jgi:hypothetical protein
MNDASYGAPVGLGPKSSGRVFKTRYIKTAYNNAVEAARLDDVTFCRSISRCLPRGLSGTLGALED